MATVGRSHDRNAATHQCVNLFPCDTVVCLRLHVVDILLEDIKDVSDKPRQKAYRASYETRGGISEEKLSRSLLTASCREQEKEHLSESSMLIGRHNDCLNHDL